MRVHAASPALRACTCMRSSCRRSPSCACADTGAAHAHPTPHARPRRPQRKEGSQTAFAAQIAPWGSLVLAADAPFSADDLCAGHHAAFSPHACPHALPACMRVARSPPPSKARPTAAPACRAALAPAPSVLELTAKGSGLMSVAIYFEDSTERRMSKWAPARRRLQL